MKKCAPIVAISLTACASAGPQAAIPSEDEVRAYVAENWLDFEGVLYRQTQAPAGSLELVDVSEVQCRGRGLLTCEFQVTAKTKAGELVTTRTSELLAYHDGKLDGPMIIVG